MNIKWIDAEMAQKRVRDVERERDELRAKNERLREEMAEWESAHAAVTELRGLVESHMDMARGEWECVATIERLRAALEEIAQLGPEIGEQYDDRDWGGDARRIAEAALGRDT